MENIISGDQLVELPTAQKELGGSSRAQMYRLIDSEKLEAVKLGRKTLLRRTSINRFIASLPNFKIAKLPAVNPQHRAAACAHLATTTCPLCRRPSDDAIDHIRD